MAVMCLSSGAMAGAFSPPALVVAEAAARQSVPTERAVGTIKAVSGNAITLTTDAGNDVAVLVQETTKFLRIAPGQKDLKDAAAISLQELLPGDRILVRGRLAEDGKSVLALSVIAMKKEDIAAKQTRDREEWQKQGVGGLVSSVDAAASTITVTLPAVGEKKSVTIHVAKDTVLRRYAPDSIKFDDARPAALELVRPGDQLRARGTRSPDGSELTAAEIVSGTFRNIAGTISSIEVSANTVTVQDLATRKAVTVKLTADSQVRKLPLPMAQRIAVRLKGAPVGAQASGAGAGSGGEGRSSSVAQRERTPIAPPGGSGPGGTGRNGGGGGDLQQAINRMPTATLGDFQKGDVVMIVATEGGPNGIPSVITLLGGVEPILQASPQSSASSIISPWSLGEPGGEAGNP